MNNQIPSIEGVVSELWTNERIKEGITRLRKAGTEHRFRGIESSIAKEMGKTPTAVKRFFWGVMLGSVNWTPDFYVYEGPYEYGELQLIKWAANSRGTKHRAKHWEPDIQYVALVLGRPFKEIKKIYKEASPLERKGFGLR